MKQRMTRSNYTSPGGLGREQWTLHWMREQFVYLHIKIMGTQEDLDLGRKIKRKALYKTAISHVHVLSINCQDFTWSSRGRACIQILTPSLYNCMIWANCFLFCISISLCSRWKQQETIRAIIKIKRNVEYYILNRS